MAFYAILAGMMILQSAVTAVCIITFHAVNETQRRRSYVHADRLAAVKRLA